ncbi:MAG: hypothetical protein Q7S73_02475 [bacterium]|nr:hypothetical protein [bacterium]
MSSQFFGLMLLIVAVAAGVYLSNNYSDLINLKIPVPTLVRPLSAPSSGFGGNSVNTGNNNSAPVLKTEKALRISSIRQANNFNSYIEVDLFSNLSKGEVVNITGWTIKSNKGSFVISNAQEIYSFGGAIGPVNVRYGDRVQIYSGFGPKGNFRLNKCLGYIEDLAPFTPSLPKNCPYISRTEINNFSGLCQDYILSLRACQNPNANPPIPYNDDACRDFLRNLNYSSCMEKHRNDEDFLINEWRLWAGNQINIFDSTHDKVQLIDKSGKVVDEYTY